MALFYTDVVEILPYQHHIRTQKRHSLTILEQKQADTDLLSQRVSSGHKFFFFSFFFLFFFYLVSNKDSLNFDGSCGMQMIL